MRVDGTDQAVRGDPFSWTELPSTKAENWQVGETFSYFVGSHDGYTRLRDPVIHSRSVICIDAGPLLVRDVALGKQQHDLEVFWHFAPELEIEQLRTGLLRVSRKADDTSQLTSPSRTARLVLDLIVPEETIWNLEITRGPISPAYGAFEFAPLVGARARTTLPAELATVLSPRATGGDPHEQTRLVSTRHPAAQVYEFIESHMTHTFCFALDKRPWNFGPWWSDAELFYCRAENREPVHFILIGGSSVSWQGQPFIKAPVPAGFFEWRKRDDLLKAEPQPFTLFPAFQEQTGVPSTIDAAMGASERRDSANEPSQPSIFAEKP